MREGLGPRRGAPHIYSRHTHKEQAPSLANHPPAQPLPANCGPVAPLSFDRVHKARIVLPAKFISLVVLLHRLPCGHQYYTLTTPRPSLQALWSGYFHPRAIAFKCRNCQDSLRKFLKQSTEERVLAGRF